MHTALCCMRAKLLQSCPTLCDSMDCSPPGSSVHGESPDRTTGVGCYAFLQGIFPTQIANLCLLSLLHWQTGSLLLVPPGKPQSSSLPQPKCLWHIHSFIHSKTFLEHYSRLGTGDSEKSKYGPYLHWAYSLTGAGWGKTYKSLTAMSANRSQDEPRVLGRLPWGSHTRAEIWWSSSRLGQVRVCVCLCACREQPL